MTQEKKQTAVEWLIEKLNTKYGNNDFIITHQNEIQQALAMEKEQSQSKNKYTEEDMYRMFLLGNALTYKIDITNEESFKDSFNKFKQYIQDL
jgi:hypothetical protein